MAYLKKIDTFDTIDNQEEESNTLTKKDALAIGGCVLLGVTAVCSTVAAVNSMQANKKASTIQAKVESWEAVEEPADKKSDNKKDEKK